jgi:hypothetical protein
MKIKPLLNQNIIKVYWCLWLGNARHYFIKSKHGHYTPGEITHISVYKDYDLLGSDAV